MIVELIVTQAAEIYQGRRTSTLCILAIEHLGHATEKVYDRQHIGRISGALRRECATQLYVIYVTAFVKIATIVAVSEIVVLIVSSIGRGYGGCVREHHTIGGFQGLQQASVGCSIQVVGSGCQTQHHTPVSVDRKLGQGTCGFLTLGLYGTHLYSILRVEHAKWSLLRIFVTGSGKGLERSLLCVFIADNGWSSAHVGDGHSYFVLSTIAIGVACFLKIVRSNLIGGHNLIFCL